jgi:hypothetical protein
MIRITNRTLPPWRGDASYSAAIRLAVLFTSYVVLPVILGALLFAFAESAVSVAPQRIRISAEGQYDPYMDDFVVFYAAGDMVRSGDADQVYQPESIHDRQARVLGVRPRDILQLPYYNPPQMLLPLAAIAALSLGAAASLWVAIELLAFGLAVAALIRARVVRPTHAVGLIGLVATVASMPFHEAIFHGQISLILLAGWVAIWFGSFRGSAERWSLLGLVLLAIKPQLAVVPIAYFAANRRWRLVCALLAVEGALLVPPILLWGPHVLADWANLLRSASTWEDENGIWVHAMFGWNAFVRALLGPELHGTRVILAMALSALTAVWVAASVRARRSSPNETFALLVFASILLSPHLFAQDLVLACVPLLILTGTAPAKERVAWSVYGLAGWVLTLVHFRWLLTDPMAMNVNWVSVWLVAGVGLAGLGMGRVLRVAAHARLSAARFGSEHHMSHHLSHTRAQVGLAIVVAAMFLVVSHGAASRTFAAAVNYTYHIRFPAIASDGLP